MGFLNTQPAPLTDDGGGDPFADFRCEHPREVQALLRELRDGAVPVALSAPGGAGLTGTVWTLDAERQRLTLDVEAGDPQLPQLVEANEVTAVAYLDAIKLQFDLQDLVLVRSTRATALQVRMPRRVYRFQRRSSYRVRTLDRSAPTAQLRHPAMPEMRLSLRIVDISIGGCALLLPDDVPPLPLGVAVHDVQLKLDSDTVLEVSLRLQHATSISAARTPGLRLGCELLRLDPTSQRALQRYIDQTQKRRRLLSLD